MKQTVKYEKRRAEIATELKALHAAIGDNDPTDEQQAKWDALKAEDTKCLAAIKREEELAEFERTTTKATVVDDPIQPVRVQNRAEKDPRWGFQTHRDFCMAVISAAGTGNLEAVDERLRPLARQEKEGTAYLLPRAFSPRSIVGAAGSDEHQTADLGYGGALVLPTFLPGLLSLGFEGDPTAGRTTMIPMASPMVSIPARTDKNHSSSISGGLTVSRRDETAAASSSLMSMERVNLVAHSLFGLAYATEEILADSPISFAAILDAGFSDEFSATVLAEKLLGTGGNKYQGVTTADCTITETRTTASTFKGRDAANMIKRCWGARNAIWLINHDVRAQLAQLHIPVPSEATPTNIVSVFQPSLQAGMPDMLMGLPVFYTEFCQTLGTSGDVILANFTQYLEGIYQPLQSAESIHVRFTNHERTFKFWLRNCGAPWWRSALTPKNSSVTLSPFVILS